jgi:hypothetical protein
MIAITAEHEALLEDLGAIPAPSWGQTALLACLRRLHEGGPTSPEEVRVVDGWAFPDGFCLIYEAPWGPMVGLRVTATGKQFLGGYVDSPTAEDFGTDIADFTVAEPLGTRIFFLVEDETGLGWFGDRPFPLSRSR